MTGRTARAALWFSVFLYLTGLRGAVHAGSGISVKIPFSYRSWQFSDSAAQVTVAQLVAPIRIMAPLGENSGLIVSAGAHSGAVDAGGSFGLSGPADTRAALFTRVLNKRLLVQTGLNIPTGPRELDPEQQIAAASLAPPYLSFHVRQPGRGLDLGAAGSYAIPLSPTIVLGIGAGHVYRGRFRAVEGGPEIRPGAETSFSAGLDVRFGGLAAKVDGTRRLYGEDDGGSTPYEEPPSWDVSTGLCTKGEAWGVELLVLAARKEKSEISPSFYSGTYLSGSGAILRRVAAAADLGVKSEVLRFQSEFEDQQGEKFRTTTGGVGPLLVLRLSKMISADAGLMRLFGRYEGKSFDGWDVRFALSLRPPAQDQ